MNISTADPLQSLKDSVVTFLPDQHDRWAKIFHARPQLGTFLQREGHKTLKQYGSDVALRSEKSAISAALKEIITAKIVNRFGSSHGEHASGFLNNISNLDTSSHGGIFSEDTLVQSHLVLAAGVRAKQNINSFISLACGVVPMNNATWPRGFFRNGQRESLFPKSFDRVAVHECPPFTAAMVEKRLADSSIDSCTRTIYEKIKFTPHIFEVEKFHQQFTLINYALWSQAVSPMITGIDHFYHLLLEDITAELIIKSIQAEDALSKLIFCDQFQGQLLETFANLPGTWTTDRKKGTFLFWRSSGDFRAASVWPEGDNLITNDGTIPFTKESIIDELSHGRLVPSVFLSLISLLFHGVRPSGGYHQIAYLPEYAKRLAEFSQKTSLTNCPIFLGNIQAADLFQLGYGFTFLADKNSETGFAGMDSLLCETPSQQFFDQQLNSVTVAQSMVMNGTRWYQEIVPKNLQ